jgi:EAL domain-containing protein (putative c-di-GMP-specific phosphodiesterase class I)/GGDEF domain-containing protein
LSAEAPLGRVPGLTVLDEQLREAIEHSQRTDTRLGLVLISLRDARRLLGTLGGAAVERLMERVQGSLHSMLRPGDRLIRCAEHDLALLLPSLLNPGHAVLAARKVLSLSQAPLDIGTAAVRPQMAIGLALCPEHALDAATLLRQAQLALNTSELNNDPWTVCDSPEAEALSSAWQIETELDEAMEAGDLRLYYQPQIDLVSGLPCGVEALARWHHPRRGVLPPSAFIPVAERSRRMGALTQWAINTALRQSSQWRRMPEVLSVAVNVPPGVAESAELPELVATARGLWAEHDQPLVIEITETSLLRTPEAARRMLGSLREAGVRVSIDDFGTGHSSLGQFRDLPVDELKIDMSFVQAMAHSETDRRIVELIIDLARAFDLGVIAEGVETVESLDLLHRMGCHRVQGFLLARPMDEDTFRDWLDHYQPIPEVAALR